MSGRAPHRPDPLASAGGGAPIRPRRADLAIALWLILIGTARSSTPWFGTLGALAGVYLVLVASALPVGLVLVGQQAGSPFVISTAVLAALTVVLTWSLTRRSEMTVA